MKKNRIAVIVISIIAVFAVMGSLVACPGGATKLSAPTNLTVDATTDGGTFSWKAVSHASGYQVQIDEGSWSATQTALTYALTGSQVTAGSHTAKVKAIGDAKDYKDSDVTSKAYTSVDQSTLDKLGAPTNVALSNGVLTWTAAQNAVGYVITAYQGAVSKGTKTVTGGSVATFNLSQMNLAAGTYTIKIKSLANHIDYADSVEVAATGTYTVTSTTESAFDLNNFTADLSVSLTIDGEEDLQTMFVKLADLANLEMFATMDEGDEFPYYILIKDGYAYSAGGYDWDWVYDADNEEWTEVKVADTNRSVNNIREEEFNSIMGNIFGYLDMLDLSDLSQLDALVGVVFDKATVGNNYVYTINSELLTLIDDLYNFLTQEFTGEETILEFAFDLFEVFGINELLEVTTAQELASLLLVMGDLTVADILDGLEIDEAALQMIIDLMLPTIISMDANIGAEEIAEMIEMYMGLTVSDILCLVLEVEEDGMGVLVNMLNTATIDRAILPYLSFIPADLDFDFKLTIAKDYSEISIYAFASFTMDEQDFAATINARIYDFGTTVIADEDYDTSLFHCQNFFLNLFEDEDTVITFIDYGFEYEYDADLLEYVHYTYSSNEHVEFNDADLFNYFVFDGNTMTLSAAARTELVDMGITNIWFAFYDDEVELLYFDIYFVNEKHNGGIIDIEIPEDKPIPGDEIPDPVPQPTPGDEIGDPVPQP